MFICFSESSACALKASLKLLSIIGGFNKTWCLSRREDKEHSCDLFPSPVIATLTVSRGLLQVAGVGSSNLKLLNILVQWIVLLAYQIYSNSALNSPGVLRVFDIAMNIFILVSFVSALLFLLLKLQISVHCSTQLLKDLLWCLMLSCLCHSLSRGFLPYILYHFVCINRNMQMQYASNEVTFGWAGVFQVLFLSLLLTTILCFENLFIFWASSGFNILNITRIFWSQTKKPVVRKSNTLM